MASEQPSGHPEIDWGKWKAAAEGDVRSPCPMINSLANHGILPHNGKAISKATAVTALTHSLNLDAHIASIFASVALTTNPDPHAHAVFDLDHLAKHGIIEHDVSLSRDDAAFGNSHAFNADIWQRYLDAFGDSKQTSFALCSRARYDRVAACKRAHFLHAKPFDYGIREALFSYGETALLLSLLGDPKNGKIPIEYLRVLVEEERLPYKEGWRPSETPVTQSDMNHIIFSLISENEHRAEEARDIGLGTVHAVQNAVSSLMPSYCTIM